jgi:hypothetical protein
MGSASESDDPGSILSDAVYTRLDKAFNEEIECVPLD